MRVIEVYDRRADICREVLDDLPEWFGIPDTKAAYIAASSDMPMFVCYRAEQPVGFLSLKAHTPFAAEIYVLGVKRRLHRQGAGRALIEAAAQFAGKQGIRFLTVKTLAPAHPDPHYAATRKFYEAVGFLPIEVFPTHWGSANPCLQMLRQI
jgi:ribosomal protein S18 acetylase RimI-like enzyme